MATTFRIGEGLEAPNLKPEIRGGSFFFGHVEARGLKYGNSYTLLAETLSRIPNEYDLGSLDRIHFLERNVTKTVAITHIYKANDIENDHRGIQRVRVYRKLWAKLSDKARIGVMAHELAHVWLNEHSGSEMSDKREIESDALARRWGFSAELDALDLEAETIL